MIGPDLFLNGISMMEPESLMKKRSRRTSSPKSTPEEKMLNLDIRPALTTCRKDLIELLTMTSQVEEIP